MYANHVYNDNKNDNNDNKNDNNDNKMITIRIHDSTTIHDSHTRIDCNTQMTEYTVECTKVYDSVRSIR